MKTLILIIALILLTCIVQADVNPPGTPILWVASIALPDGTAVYVFYWQVVRSPICTTLTTYRPVYCARYDPKMAGWYVRRLINGHPVDGWQTLDGSLIANGCYVAGGN